MKVCPISGKIFQTKCICLAVQFSTRCLHGPGPEIK